MAKIVYSNCTCEWKIIENNYIVKLHRILGNIEILEVNMVLHETNSGSIFVEGSIYVPIHNAYDNFYSVEHDFNHYFSCTIYDELSTIQCGQRCGYDLLIKRVATVLTPSVRLPLSHSMPSGLELHFSPTPILMQVCTRVDSCAK